MGSGGEDRLGTGRNHRDTAELDEYTGNFGKNRNDEGESDAEEEQPGSFTRAPSIVSLTAGKFTDYDACHLGLSSRLGSASQRSRAGLTARCAPATLRG